MSPFQDLLAGNERFAATFALGGLSPRAARGVAILTCIDSRIPPLEVFELVPGDAKILRNAGARVTEDMIRTLAIATSQLGVTRIAVMRHTDCAAGNDNDAQGLHEDLQRLRDDPRIPDDVELIGLRYDVETGRVAQL